MAIVPRSLLVIGAGPIGIETALAARAGGLDVIVVERGRVAENVRSWGFVTLFSPWKLDTSSLGSRTLLEEGAWRQPPEAEASPTGIEFVERYLEPLARSRALEGVILERTRVVAVGREGLLKGEAISSDARAARPFRILVEDDSGRERVLRADSVIDASGTYGNSNHLGGAGVPAPGERALRGRVRYVIPDVLGSDRARYAGRTTLVVGHGHSAATALAGLSELARANPKTRVVWAIRTDRREPFASIERDPLAARAELATLGNRIAVSEGGSITVHRSASVEALAEAPDGSLRVSLDVGGRPVEERVDEVLALVGYRPDSEIYRELQIHECYASQAPIKLAAALLGAGGASADCLAQTSHGPETLRNPEPNFVILGAKSYGRGSSFLLKIGHEQVREALELLCGSGSRTCA